MREAGGTGHARRWTAVVLLLALCAACTGGGGDEGPGSSPSSTYRPKGRIVVLSGRFLTGLNLLDAASGKELPLRMPRLGGAFDAAAPGPDGKVWAMPTLGLFSPRSVGQLFLLSAGKPERVGPSITGANEFQVRGDSALGWGCPGHLQLLDLSRPTEWRTIGAGCAGSLSPDGTRLAYATPRSLFVMDLPDGTPREVLRFRDLPGLRAAHVPAQSLENVKWGTPGVAVEIGDASTSAMAVWREGKEPLVVPLGKARLGPMEWQPGGNILAFFDYAPSGELLALDGETGAHRQIAVSDFGQLAWSPDGKAVAAARSANVLALVEPHTGEQLGALAAPGVPIAWAPG